MIPQEFTGERFIPGAGGWQLAYEHIHRYLFASHFARGQRALDIATGEGYGAALLASTANRVWAVDIDGSSIAHARARHVGSNIEFLQADAIRLPLRPGSIGLAVAMEVIEHVADQQSMVREIHRVLAPHGIALISTPDKAAYSDARGYSNPYHVKELYKEEFLSLLREFFPIVRLVYQQVRAGSLITPDVRFTGNAQIVADSLPVAQMQLAYPMYLLAVCSPGPPLESGIQGSAYLDTSDALLNEWLERLEKANAEIGLLNHEIQRLGSWGRGLEAVLARKDEAIRDCTERAEREIALRDQNTDLIKSLMLHEIEIRDANISGLQAQLKEEIRVRDSEYKRLQGEIAGRDDSIRALQSEMEREVRRRDRTIEDYQRIHADLEMKFDERAAWALSLQKELEDRSHDLSRIRQAFLYRILRRLGILPE